MDAIDAPSPSPLGQDRPLDGLKVVELATVLAGPLVGTFLAELGAEVIKVEPPGRGDVTRHWRSQGESIEGPSAYFAAANGPKRPMRLDLKSASGQGELADLLDDADVLLQNAKPSSLRGLGLDPEALQQRFPRLIHVHLKGFLHEAHRGGYDMAVQAETGFMSMNGNPDGDPMRMPVALMDVLAAHQMRSALLLALYERERSGHGAYIETWLDASGFSALANRATEFLVAGQTPEPLGAVHPQIAPYGESFVCACDGRVVMAVGSDDQFNALATLLGHPEWATDDRYSTNPARVDHRVQLTDSLSTVLAKWRAEDLLTQAKKLGIPMGRVLSVPEALNSPTGRSMTASFAWEGHPVRHVRQVAFRIHRNGNRTT